MSNKLEKKIIIKGDIITETGIMVGGNNSAFEIGGTDKQVIRNPVNQLPYIPGSSLKGKMRSLLEISMGTFSRTKNGYGPSHNPSRIPAQLFGHIKDRKDNNNESQQASRVIVRDSELKNAEIFDGKTELLYTEVKAENSIDRITSAANPRFFERVPKGAKFDLNIILSIYENDENKDEFLKTIFSCLKMIQDDYVGGGGSRGNGQVSFNIAALKERTVAYYLEDAPENDISHLIPEELKANSDD